MRKVKSGNQDFEKYELRYSPHWLRVEGWAVDKDQIRHRIGFVYGYWWYERLGFASYRVYCNKEFIEKNFTPITHLQEVKHAGY
ncbi:MAG: hypothetical protein ACREOB_04270 [Thermodesulfobacteriota bacterium]